MMLNETQIVDLWLLFTDHNDNVPASLAERYVELLVDFGTGDSLLKKCMGTDPTFDEAIKFYLEEDEDFDDDDDDDDDDDELDLY